MTITTKSAPVPDRRRKRHYVPVPAIALSAAVDAGQKLAERIDALLLNGPTPGDPDTVAVDKELLRSAAGVVRDLRRVESCRFDRGGDDDA